MTTEPSCEAVQIALIRGDASPDQEAHAAACPRCRKVRQLSRVFRSRMLDRDEDAPRVADAFEPGQELLRYRLHEVLGEGGQGVVFRATEIEVPDSIVALKIVPREGFGEDDSLREVKHAKKLTHPNVCRINHTEVHGPFRLIEMQYVDGGTLEARELTAALSMEVFRGICDGVAYVHGEGVLHLDLKPRNVLLDRAGVPIVADFGMSTRAGGEAFGGTQRYMAPEVAAGHEPDVRADVYSLGALLCDLFPRRSRALERVAGKAMAAGREHRFDDVAGLRCAFDQAVTPWTRRRWAVGIAVIAAGSIAAAGVSFAVRVRDPPLDPERTAIIVGGRAASGVSIGSAEAFDVVHRRWVALPEDPAGGRCGARALALPGGRVLVAGGGAAEGCRDDGTTTNATRILDISARAWTPLTCQPPCIRIDQRTLALRGSGWEDAACEPSGPCLAYARDYFAATELPDGRVFVFGGCAGGCNGPSALQQTLAGDFELGRIAEIFDPEQRRWRQTPVSPTPRRASAVAVVVHARVLVCGGNDGFRETLRTCELFDTNSHFNGAPAWRAAGETPAPIVAMAPLPDGRVIGLIAGDPGRSLLWNNETFWSDGPPLAVRQDGAGLVRLAGGDVLLIGGRRDGTALGDVQRFDAHLGTWTVAPSLRVARFGHAAVALPGDLVIVSGGCVGGAMADAEIFEHGAWAELPKMQAARCDPMGVAGRL